MRLPGSRSVWRMPAAVLHTLTPPLLDRCEPRTEPGRRDCVAGRTASFEVRGASGPEGETRCRALEEALGRHPGVAWARVNAPLKRILIGLSDSAPTADELAAAVRQVAGVTVESSGDLLPGGLTGPVRRSGMALAADAAGLALASVGRLSRWAPLPAELASLVTLVDTQPRLRRRLERLLGQENADLALATANAGALGLTQGYVGLGTDAVVAWRRPERGGRPLPRAVSSRRHHRPREPGRLDARPGGTVGRPGSHRSAGAAPAGRGRGGDRARPRARHQVDGARRAGARACRGQRAVPGRSPSRPSRLWCGGTVRTWS